jgi:hypothetical protein
MLGTQQRQAHGKGLAHVNGELTAKIQRLTAKKKHTANWRT